MLIYPEVGRSLRMHYRLLGIPVVVATVDLGQKWQEIETELNGLLDDCRSAALSRVGATQREVATNVSVLMAN
jgi:5-methylcytosine-specific restriction enzyme subunit McrC